MRNESARIGAGLALAVILTAQGALAQKTSTKDKPAPAPAPDVSATVTPPVTEATVAPADTDAVATVAPTPVPQAPRSDDELDVTEKPGQKYYFAGLRYRGQLIPQAFINIFVDGGASVWTNSIGLEFDMRKDGFSLIPNITYSDYGTGNLLFLQKNKAPQDVGNWSMIHSSLKVLYFGLDFLWSVNIAKNFDFEYGLGFGIGVVFGDLFDDWVRATNNPNQTFTLGGEPGTAKNDGNGSIANFPNHYYVPCTVTGPPGCNAGNHSNASVNKVGDYSDPHGFNPIPTLFFNVSIPQIGVRIKPIKSAEARIGFAFNIPNGFVFGISGDYGLEKVLEKK